MTPTSSRALSLSLTLFLVVGCGGAGGESETTDGSEGAAAESTAPAPLADSAERAAEARARMESSEGGRLVLRAIEAHGGLDRWFATPTSSFGWEYSNEELGYRFRSEMVVHNRSRLAYHEMTHLGTPDDRRPFEGRMAWDGERAWFSPADSTRVNARFWALSGYYFEMIPFVFADPGVRYEKLPSEELDGETYDMVKVSFEPGVGDADDYYVTYVDRETGLVRAVRYVVTFGGRPAGDETLFYYDDYVTVDGLTVPTRFRGYGFADGERGEFRNEAWADEIDFSVPFDTARLERPDDSRIDPLPGEDEGGDS